MPRARTIRALLAVACWAASALAGHAQDAGSYRQKVRTFHTVEEFERLTRGRVRVERRHASPAAVALLPRSPVRSFTVVGVESPTVTWFGTREGAIRFNRASSSLEYFHGGRWLPEDHVTGFAFDRDAAWVETPKGFARIEYQPMTLEEKSRRFIERVQHRHTRWGLTADSHLKQAGDLSTNQTVPSDNDGLWTAMYVAAECFRYKVTGETDARENARRGMQAIMRLEAITGIPGFPARTFIRVGEEQQPADGEWHDTPDGAWRWKGDTSSDEIAGHYFVYPLYYDLVAAEHEKPSLRAAIERITNHILDNRYQLIDVGGRRTRWGWWGPDAIWDSPDETGLRALLILSHLRVALHMASGPDFRAKVRAAYDDLVGTHNYHLLTRNQKIMVPGSINHSDDELAFLAYYPLLRYETDSTLREVYALSLARSWQIERPERNPLWNFIYAAGTGAGDFDRAESLRTLQEIPTDQIKWDVRNSHRQDVPVSPMSDRFGRKQALAVLPYDELPMWKWNENPFLLDRSDGGRGEGDGVYFLLPYWMGRYHGLIAAPATMAAVHPVEDVMSRALLVLAALLFSVNAASAQLFQWTPEQLTKYTKKNPYERFPDGRPKVPDEMLERLKGLIAEEVQAALGGQEFPNQFESRDGWKVLQPDKKMVGRVLTIQFMPARGDVIEVDEADAKARGTTAARNQTAIDMLQPGDVIVADVFGANWNFVGNKLAHYIQTTTRNGMIVDGGVYWLDRIADTGMQAYYKNSFPTQGMRVMVTGINIPVRIGRTLVMPGDVVLADREGLWFIPPHKVQEVVESGEMSKARDDWSLMMLGTGKYTSRQIYGPLTPELQKQRDDYVFQKTGRRAPRSQ